MPDEQQIGDLETERRRLKAEMDALTLKAQETEPDRKGQIGPSNAAVDAQQRLTKLNDDYRQLLIAMKPAAATTQPHIEKLDDGRIVSISPDGKTASLVPGIPATVKPQTLDSQTIVLNGKIYDIDPDNPNGDFRVRGGGTTEDDQKKAADRANREYNKALNGHYATDEELLKYTTDLQKVGIDKAAAARDQIKFEKDQERLDAAEARTAALHPGTLAQQDATLKNTDAATGQIGANTSQTQQNIDFAAQNQPNKMAQDVATRLGTIANTAGTEASTANQLQATQIAGAPTVQAPPTGMSQWARDPKTGAISQGDINLEWQAKTQADVAARVGQIRSLMQQKSAEVQQKVDSKVLTAEQAYAEFNAWYDKNVGSQVEAIKAAQHTAQIEQAKTQQAMRTSAMTTAQASGQQALNAYQQLRESHPMNEQTQNVFSQLGQGKKLKDIDMRGAFQWDGPNPIDLAQQGTQNALKYIDRSAAEANGLPPPDFSGIDIDSMLGRKPYLPGGGAPVPAPMMAGGGAPPPVPPPAPPVAPPTDNWFTEWQKRQAADSWEQQQQALVPMIGSYGG